MNPIIKNINYIFRYKDSGAERKNALFFILSYLRKLFTDLEITVVEQGEQQTLFLPTEWKVDVILDKYTGVFNSCRPYNIGARNTKKPILVFSDADIFLKKEDYLTCFAATDAFEAVTPNKDYAINVEIGEAERHTFRFLNDRRIYTFAGGLVIFRRAAFERIGGWDERFFAWGHEDVVMSHLIFQTLKSKSFFLPFYHIDHPLTGRYKSLNYNQVLKEEIETFNEQSLENYIQILKNQHIPEPIVKCPKFVLTVASSNGFKNLKTLVESFLKTKSSEADWTLLVVGNGPNDKLRSWIMSLHADCMIILLENENKEISPLRQENLLLKKLEKMDFDLCFKSSDELVFKEKGWDKLYWQTVQKTGYDHLVFYDTSRKAVKDKLFPIHCGELTAYCPPDYLQGLFYTLTPRLIKQVGYLDEQRLQNGYGLVDYILRSCRLGFNVLQYPFDVKYSNQFIGLQTEDEKDWKVVSKRYTRRYIKNIHYKETRLLVLSNRSFLPYQENDFLEALAPVENTQSERFNVKCDATYHPKLGVVGVLSFLIRRFYNLAIDCHLYFIPKTIKKIGWLFNKIGTHLMRIDRH